MVVAQVENGKREEQNEDYLIADRFVGPKRTRAEFYANVLR